MLVLRYSGAIHRYLFKDVGDPEVVEDWIRSSPFGFSRANSLTSTQAGGDSEIT